VDALASEFFALVSEHRQIPAETVSGFGASIFTSQSALNAGLADAILTRSELVALVTANPIETAMKFSAIAKAAAAAEDTEETPQVAAAECDETEASAESEEAPAEEEEDGPDYDKAMKAIMALAESDDDKGEMCRKMLAALKPSSESEEDKPEAAAAAPATSAAAQVPSVDKLAEAVYTRIQEQAEKSKLRAETALQVEHGRRESGTTGRGGSYRRRKRRRPRNHEFQRTGLGLGSRNGAHGGSAAG
jgi:ClpP class serine protease